MPVIQFKIKDLKPLLEELNQAECFSPTVDDLFDPQNYPNGVVVDQNGHEEKDSTEDYFWPSQKHMDLTKIKPQFILVGDHGIYMMTNAKKPKGESKKTKVVYAKGCNPDLDEDFYENKMDLFGSDDGTIAIAMKWIEQAIACKQRTFKIQLTETEVAIL